MILGAWSSICTVPSIQSGVDFPLGAMSSKLSQSPIDLKLPTHICNCSPRDIKLLGDGLKSLALNIRLYYFFCCEMSQGRIFMNTFRIQTSCERWHFRRFAPVVTIEPLVSTILEIYVSVIWLLVMDHLSPHTDQWCWWFVIIQLLKCHGDNSPSTSLGFSSGF